MARYEIRDSDSGELLSRHRTRQGSIDAWRAAPSPWPSCEDHPQAVER